MPPTLSYITSVAVLSLTMIISVSMSLTVSTAPASSERMIPVPGRFIASVSVMRSVSANLPSSICRNASTMSGILITLMVSICWSALSAISSPVSRHLR